MGIRCADHVTPLYPQKLAVTSPTGGSRSVGIVRVRTKATEFLIKVKTYLVRSTEGTLQFPDNSDTDKCCQFILENYVGTVVM